MDLLTQGLLGSSLAVTGAKREEVRRASLIGLLAGLSLVGTPVLSGILIGLLAVAAVVALKARMIAMLLAALAGNLLLLNTVFPEQFVNALLIEALVLSCVTLYRRVKFNVSEERN